MGLIAACVFIAGVAATAQDNVKNTTGRMGCCPAHLSDAVLPADQFSGKVAESYAAAKEIAGTCRKLFCYCGCDYTDNHTNLLDCFTTNTCDACPVCQNEVLEAYRLRHQGKALGAIQEIIDTRFEPEYAFNSKPTKALLDYRARRMYTPRNASTHTTTVAQPPLVSK